EEARRGLDQYHHLDLGGPEKLRLVVDVFVPARRERMSRRAGEQPRVVRLIAGRQARQLGLDGGVGRRDEDTEMAGHAAILLHRMSLSAGGRGCDTSGPRPTSSGKT